MNRRNGWIALGAVLFCMMAIGSLLAQPSAEGPGGGKKEPPSSQPAAEPSTQPSGEPTAPSKNRAWISGTLLDADGKPAAMAALRAEKHEPMGMGGGGGGGGRHKTQKIQTDENGNFVFKELEPGLWTVIAGSQEVGWVYQEFEAKAGEENKVGTLQMVKI